MASRFPIDVSGEVPQGGSPILTRRVVGNSGTAITQASLTSIAYSVYTFDLDTKVRTVVANHSAVSINKTDVIFDTLQTDIFWRNADGQLLDPTDGYNFRHQVPHLVTTTTFATAGTVYLVEYTLTPVSGEPILLRFLLTCV